MENNVCNNLANLEKTLLMVIDKSLALKGYTETKEYEHLPDNEQILVQQRLSYKMDYRGVLGRQIECIKLRKDYLAGVSDKNSK